MPQFRIPPSGALFLGTTAGQVPVWNGSEWLPQAQSSGGQELYDYVLTSRADLVAVVAPVGDVFELPSGSYAVTESFALDADESLNVANGESVFMTCFGSAVLSGDPTNGAAVLVNVEAGARLELVSANLTCGGTTNECIESAGDLRISGGIIRGGSNSTEALSLTGGECIACGVEFRAGASSSVFLMGGGIARFIGCLFEGGQAFACLMSAGELHMASCQLVGGTSAALQLDSVNTMRAVLQDCYLTSGTTNAVVVTDGAAAYLEMVNCNVAADAANAHCVRPAAARSVSIIGGVLQSLNVTPGDGVQVAGAMVDLSLIGVRGENIDDLVQRVAGTVLNCNVIGCYTNSAGINWAAANIPSNGLVIVGCNFGAANPFTGFTASDARVNIKACTRNNGLLSETAIVP